MSSVSWRSSVARGLGHEADLGELGIEGFEGAVHGHHLGFGGVGLLGLGVGAQPGTEGDGRRERERRAASPSENGERRTENRAPLRGDGRGGRLVVGVHLNAPLCCAVIQFSSIVVTGVSSTRMPPMKVRVVPSSAVRVAVRPLTPLMLRPPLTGR